VPFGLGDYFETSFLHFSIIQSTHVVRWLVILADYILSIPQIWFSQIENHQQKEALKLSWILQNCMQETLLDYPLLG
jgi:hypothetical protein